MRGVVGCAPAAERHRPTDGLVQLGGRPPGVGRSRVHAVHRDPPVGERVGEAACHLVDRPLRHRVRGARRACRRRGAGPR